MDTMKTVLKHLELGSSVAEHDQDLEKYFVETQTFRQLIDDRKDIIAGDKGTGKTAVFKILQKRYNSESSTYNTIVLPAFNPSGTPIFEELTNKIDAKEGDFNIFWNTFIFSLVGNWALKHNRIRSSKKLKPLNDLLVGINMRSDDTTPKTIFNKLYSMFDSMLLWKSAEVDFTSSPDGKISFTPRINFDINNESKEKSVIKINDALSLLNDVLKDINKTVWVALDRLDEAFQGHPDIEIPALRALFRAYLDMNDFSNIRLKLFVRRDLFARIIEGGFVNLTHINARKVEIIWDNEDLLSLLCRRIKENEDFILATNSRNMNDADLFNRVFPDQVDQGSRKPKTFDWIISRVKDGNGVSAPRNIIDLIEFARDAQLRKEDREPRPYSDNLALIEGSSLRKALENLSDRRVNDTLFAEAAKQVHLIEKFRNGKSEYTYEQLEKILATKGEALKLAINQLMIIGFIEESRGSYKIPMIYRSGLQITQGKTSN